MIVNTGSSSNFAADFSAAIIKGIEDYLNDIFKKLAPSTQTDGIGFFVEGGPNIAGSLLGAAAALIIDQSTKYLLGLLSADCDGVVANEAIVYRNGRDLQMQVQSQGPVINVKTRHDGTDSPEGCGGNSLYWVFWSVSRG
jgi:hypothetical protein